MSTLGIEFQTIANTGIIKLTHKLIIHFEISLRILEEREKSEKKKVTGWELSCSLILWLATPICFLHSSRCMIAELDTELDWLDNCWDLCFLAWIHHQELVAIDLFSGCGGMSFVAQSNEKVSIVTKHAVDLDHDSLLSFKANHPDSYVSILAWHQTMLQQELLAFYGKSQNCSGCKARTHDQRVKIW